MMVVVVLVPMWMMMRMMTITRTEIIIMIIFSRMHATLHPALSVRRSVGHYVSLAGDL